MAHFRRVVKRAMSAVLPNSLWITQVPVRCGAVALTFDDGPHPENTPRVLDALKSAGACATFFIVGREAAKYPELVRRIVAEGHEIGNHSYFHGEPEETTPHQLLAEVTACGTLLGRLVEQVPSYFRPPKGELSWRKVLGLWRMRQTIVLWNVDSKDYTRRSPEEFAQWTAGYGPHGGDVVLLHDDRPVTAAALPILLQKIRDAHLGFTTLSGWRRQRAGAPGPQLSVAGAEA